MSRCIDYCCPSLSNVKHSRHYDGPVARWLSGLVYNIQVYPWIAGMVIWTDFSIPYQVINAHP